MQVTGETTIAEIVAGDFRTAAVFQEFGIDFCCGGRRTVLEACQERHIDADVVRQSTRSSRGFGRYSRPAFASGLSSTVTMSAVKSNLPANSDEPTP